MSLGFTTLPLPLILLIHLHILNYPHVNEPQYDNNLFDGRKKGLRDRVKMMEDISFFLVGQLEPGASARNIFPTYPCTQPSDSLAFRTSLFKYLETLRHDVLFSSRKGNVSVNASTKQNKPTSGEEDSDGASWWWKDVLVRKSLLEECTGDRFESLLVAFSTHVLLHKSRAYTQIQLFGLAGTVPASYDALLLRCQSSRRTWLQKASLLNQRRQKLDQLKRMILAKQEKMILPTYKLDHIITLARIKRADIQSRLWPQERGSSALGYFLQLAGLAVILPRCTLFPYEIQDKCAKPTRTDSRALPPLLPLSAARYPTELKRLQCSVVPPSRDAQNRYDQSGSFAQIWLSDDLASIKIAHKQLQEALTQAREKQRQLPRPLPKKHQRSDLRFQHATVTRGGNLFNKPNVDCALLARFSLHDPTDGDTYEQKVEHIRRHVLPPLSPPLPELPSPEIIISQIPRLKPVAKANPKNLPKAPGKACKSRIATKPHNSIQATLVHDMVEGKQMVEDEASKIVLATKDDSTEDIEFTTLPPKVPPNRIWTFGQKQTRRPGISKLHRSPITMFEEPLAKLPVIPDTSTGSMSMLDDRSDIEGNKHKPSLVTNSISRSHNDEASDDGECSQTSMIPFEKYSLLPI